MTARMLQPARPISACMIGNLSADISRSCWLPDKPTSGNLVCFFPKISVTSPLLASIGAPALHSRQHADGSVQAKWMYRSKPQAFACVGFGVTAVGGQFADRAVVRAQAARDSYSAVLHVCHSIAFRGSWFARTSAISALCPAGYVDFFCFQCPGCIAAHWAACSNQITAWQSLLLTGGLGGRLHPQT